MSCQIQCYVEQEEGELENYCHLADFTAQKPTVKNTNAHMHICYGYNSNGFIIQHH